MSLEKRLNRAHEIYLKAIRSNCPEEVKGLARKAYLQLAEEYKIQVRKEIKNGLQI